jgi:hypothetical protein
MPVAVKDILAEYWGIARQLEPDIRLFNQLYYGK